MMKHFVQFFSSTFILLCLSFVAKAQTNNQNLMAFDNAVVDITSNETWNNEIKFGNNSTLNIKNQSTLVFSGNLNQTGKTVTINIEEGATLQFSQVLNFLGNYTFNIAKGGKLLSGTSYGLMNFKVGDGIIKIENYGTIEASVFDIVGNTQKTIDNYEGGLINIEGNINISGDTRFRNFGSIYVGSRYNNSSESFYINCGIIYSKGGFNLSGGKIINTNLMISKSIDFGNQGSELKNYGVLWALGSLNANKHNIRTAGISYFEELTANESFITNADPEDGINSTGVIYISNNNKVKGNNYIVGPNLDFTKTDFTSYKEIIESIGNAKSLDGVYKKLFIAAPRPNTSITSADIFEVSSVKYYHPDLASPTSSKVQSETANVTFNERSNEIVENRLNNVSSIQCPNMDGVFTPASPNVIATDDNFNILSGSTSDRSILENDNYNGQEITLDHFVINQISTSNPGVTVDVNTGKVIVNSGTQEGTYTIVYEIVSKDDPNVKSQATITVVVIKNSEGNIKISNCLPYIPVTTPSSSIVTAIYETVPQISSTVGTINYGKGVGKLLTSLTIDNGTATIQRISTPKSKFYIRRNDVSTQLPYDNLYIENRFTTLSDLALSYPTNIEDFFSSGFINAGLDNAFSNVGVQTTNAERYDIVFENGYKVIDPSNEMILVSERGMNDEINIAVIKSVDNSNVPNNLGNVIKVSTNKMFKVINNMSYKIIRRVNVNENYTSQLNDNQPIGISVITYKDLGVSAGETIYGYVLLPSDYANEGATALEYHKFPKDTNENSGGHDIGIIYGVFSSCEDYVCYNSEYNTDPSIPVNHGISLLNRNVEEKDSWPMIRNSGFTVLESNHKGFVPTRMSKVDIEGDLSTPSKITNPQEGMMIFDTTEKCLKIYDGTKWSCFSEPACP